MVSSPIKTLILLSAYQSIGGIQRFNRNLVDALNDNGHALSVLVLNDAKTDIGALDLNGCTDVDLYVSGRSKVRFAVEFLWRVFVGGYDNLVIGHVHFLLLAYLGSLLSLRGVGFRSVILHGVEVWGHLGFLDRFVLRRLNGIVSVSRYTQDDALKQLNGRFSGSCHILGNTLNKGIYGQDVKDSTSTGNENFELVTVARLDRIEVDKGVRDIIFAVSQVSRSVKVVLNVVGDGDDIVELKRIAVSLGVGEFVRFHGRLSDKEMWAIYKRSKIFILPSKKEGFGIVFLEAAFFGLPSIGASEKGILDVIDHGVNGFLVKFGDIDAIAEHILCLRSDSSLLAKMGQSARESVVGIGRHSYETFKARVGEIYGIHDKCIQ